MITMCLKGSTLLGTLRDEDAALRLRFLLNVTVLCAMPY